jgi:predicted transcriptional regulator
MKSVLISIQPKWCELISSGKKTVEVRKTKPKLEVPFKCYIYCTQGQLKDLGIIGNEIYQKRMKVIGEFVCDRIVKFENSWYDPAFAETSDLSCVGFEELAIYIGKKDFGYGWHITDLVIYDKPRESSEFYTEGDCDCMSCKKCYWFDRGNGYNVENDCNLAYKCVELHKSFKPIIRPPQSWCYVERSENGK